MNQPPGIPSTSYLQNLRTTLAMHAAPVQSFQKLAYAGTLSKVERLASSHRYRFTQGYICDPQMVRAVIAGFLPNAVYASRGREPCRPLDRRTERAGARVD